MSLHPHPGHRWIDGVNFTEKDAAEIDALVNERLTFRKTGNWTEADRIRDKLRRNKIRLNDYKCLETGELMTAWDLEFC